LAFCIGAHNQQHACVVGKCSVIDWAKQHASPCSSTIMQFTNAQSPGLATPCCDNQFCTTPAPQSFICTPTAELWLCVVDGAATECVKPRDNTICSGNFTNPVAIVSTTSSYVFSMPTGTSTADGGTDTSFPLSSTGASRGLSSQDIIIIVVVVVVGSIALLAGGLIYKKVLPACRRRRRLSSARANNVTVSGGALTEVRGDHNTYHIYPAEISMYHLSSKRSSHSC
jgi:hypothetical protein